MNLTKNVDVFEEKPKKKSRSVPQQENHSELVDDFINLMDRWHSTNEVWDDDLDAEMSLMEYQVRKTHRPRLAWGEKGTKYFSPSSANSDARELYMKLSKAQRDKTGDLPHQGRWKRLGTVFGDVLQRDLLFIEKHHEKKLGKVPEFLPTWTTIKDKQFPRWEKFAQKIVWIEHRGHTIPILGQPDGLLKHTPTGKDVGLEVKSKQTTSAQTSKYSMREEKEDHFKQCVNYSIMYGIDDFLVVYGNLAKKAWFMSEEDYNKTPDLRAFHVKITESDRQKLLDYYADILDAIDEKNPPKLDLNKWTFNNFKQATAKSLTDDEVKELEQEVKKVNNVEKMPEWKKENFKRALEEIKELRDNE